jgi:transcriptional regulator with XRE-family HTH domain
MLQFAKNLKNARERNGMTQAEMALKLSVPLRSYQNYESQATNHCEPDQEMLLKISKILKIPVGELLGENTFNIYK